MSTNALLTLLKLYIYIYICPVKVHIIQQIVLQSGQRKLSRDWVRKTVSISTYFSY